jgi:hypothetical protein
MATMTAEPQIVANDVEIKQAMSVLKIGNWADELLDEIELRKQLKISLEQADRGELIPASEVKKEIEELFANGHFDR